MGRFKKILRRSVERLPPASCGDLLLPSEERGLQLKNQSECHTEKRIESQTDWLGQLHEIRSRARQHSFSEVSELVLHDLKKPLAVVKFCIDQLDANPSLLTQKPQYLEKIKTNLDRAFQIIESFGAVVRADVSSQHSRYDVCHKAAIKILNSSLKELDPILIVEFDPSLEGVVLPIPHFEVVHLLETLYRFLVVESHLSKSPQLCLSVTKDSVVDGILTVLVATNTTKPLMSLEDHHDVLPRFNSLNIRAIQQQLQAYGGDFEQLPQSTSQEIQMAIRLRLPLLETGYNKGAYK